MYEGVKNRRKFYQNRGRIDPRGLRAMARDYAQAYNCSIFDVKKMRLDDFIAEYVEAAEDMKKRRDKAARWDDG